jgi:hypothetical protein
MVETISSLDKAIAELQEAIYTVAWSEKWKLIELQERAQLIRDTFATLGDEVSALAAQEYLDVHEEVMQALRSVA